MYIHSESQLQRLVGYSLETTCYLLDGVPLRYSFSVHFDHLIIPSTLVSLSCACPSLYTSYCHLTT